MRVPLVHIKVAAEHRRHDRVAEEPFDGVFELGLVGPPVGIKPRAFHKTVADHRTELVGAAVGARGHKVGVDDIVLGNVVESHGWGLQFNQLPLFCCTGQST